ncbi:MAG: SET domain-containing protein-lysine N-methyltransferase [Patescibacteria group bacterium]
MQRITIQQSKVAKGLGIFADEDIEKGELIEKAPLLLMSVKEFEHIKKTKLYYYFFEYTNKHFAIALGYGSLYNHSYRPNARYLYNYKNKHFKIVAIKGIKKGEEILFNYNYYPDDQTPLDDWYKEKVDV